MIKSVLARTEAELAYTDANEDILYMSGGKIGFVSEPLIATDDYPLYRALDRLAQQVTRLLPAPDSDATNRPKTPDPRAS